MNIVQRFASPGYDPGLMYRPCYKSAPAVAAAAPLLAKVAPAAISAIGSVVGSIFGKKSSDNTNKMNLQIARENNAFNERMFDRQIAYNWDMFNAENQYNSPIEQAARYRAAGINPALAMEGDSMASAQGGSVSPPSASQVAPMQSYDPSAAIQHVADIVYNEERRQAELRSMELANQNAELNNQDKADEVRYNNLYRDLTLRRGKQQLMNDMWQGMLSGQQYNYNVDTYPERVKLVSEDLRKRRGEADYQAKMIIAADLENKLKKYNLEKAPEQFKAQMTVLGAQAYAAFASGSASYATAFNQYKQAAKAAAETYGINLNNDLLFQTFDSAVHAVEQENWAKYRENMLNGQAYMDAFDYLYKQPGARNTIGRAYSLGRATGLSINPGGLSASFPRLGR